MNVKNVFLNEDLSKEVYMLCPPKYNHPPNEVYHLWKALYGLKQALEHGLQNSTPPLTNLAYLLALMIMLSLPVELKRDILFYYYI